MLFFDYEETSGASIHEQIKNTLFNIEEKKTRFLKSYSSIGAMRKKRGYKVVLSDRDNFEKLLNVAHSEGHEEEIGLLKYRLKSKEHPLLGLHVCFVPKYDSEVIYLFQDKIEEYSLMHGFSIENIYSYVYIHESMHAFFYSKNRTGYNCVSELEEAFAEAGVLEWLSENRSKIEDSLRSDAYKAIENKKNYPGTYKYALGIDIHTYYFNKGNTIDAIQQYRMYSFYIRYYMTMDDAMKELVNKYLSTLNKPDFMACCLLVEKILARAQELFNNRLFPHPKRGRTTSLPLYPHKFLVECRNVNEMAFKIISYFFRDRFDVLRDFRLFNYLPDDNSLPDELPGNIIRDKFYLLKIWDAKDLKQLIELLNEKTGGKYYLSVCGNNFCLLCDGDQCFDKQRFNKNHYSRPELEFSNLKIKLLPTGLFSLECDGKVISDSIISINKKSRWEKNRWEEWFEVEALDSTFNLYYGEELPKAALKKYSTNQFPTFKETCHPHFWECEINGERYIVNDKGERQKFVSITKHSRTFTADSSDTAIAEYRADGRDFTFNIKENCSRGYWRFYPWSDTGDYVCYEVVDERNKHGLMDGEGKIFIECKYDSIEFL